jgi:hypothetical protein
LREKTQRRSFSAAQLLDLGVRFRKFYEFSSKYSRWDFSVIFERFWRFGIFFGNFSSAPKIVYFTTPLVRKMRYKLYTESNFPLLARGYDTPL